MNAKPVYIKYFSGDVNAGDLASPYLIGKVANQDPISLPLREPTDQEHFMGVGSTLAHSSKSTIVWGTGIMKPTLEPKGRPTKIVGVRGPLTRSRLEQLGYENIRVIGDGGLATPQFYNPSVEITHKVGFIPHYVDEDEPFCDEVRDRGGLVFSPQQALQTYLNSLLRCEFIISSSLHGLIFAHAYDRPAIWVNLSDRVVGEGFKFRDYYAFLGVEAWDIPRWRMDRSYYDNLATATAPKRPTITRFATEMLHDEMSKRGYF